MSTPSFLQKWLSISFFNLLLVAFLGVVLRYKIAFYLPFIEQKFVLHGHSHFAFSGWITQTIMVLLIHHLSLQHTGQIFKRYQWLLYANLFSAYGMLVSFVVQGYALFSITFSTLSIIISYFFAFFYWNDLNKLKEKRISNSWFKTSLACSVFSSVGTFFLAYMMMLKITDQHLYLASVYFFLHFQYNGWFFLAGMGLLVSQLEKIPGTFKYLKSVFLLFSIAILPAYFLSVLWIPLPAIAYGIILIAVICQLAGWILMIKFFLKNKAYMKQNFSKNGRILLLLSATAFSIKLLLQSGSVHPALSQLSYGFRPIIIGYLHLVLLGVTSIFIIGYIISFELVRPSRKLLSGITIFVAGVIINELLLMLQGVKALESESTQYINEMLLVAAIILFSGIGTMFVGALRNADNNLPKV